MHTNKVIEIEEDIMNEIVIPIDLVELSSDGSSDLVASNNIAHVDSKDTLVGLNSIRKEGFKPHILHSLAPNNNKKGLAIISLWIRHS